MEKTKLIIAISSMLIAFGIIFALLPHDVQKLLTFGVNIPHFWHFVMGFLIIGFGVVCIIYSMKQGTFRLQFPQFEKTRIILNKSKIPLVILIILISGFLVLKYFSKDVEASPEFDKLKEAAKHCTNPVVTDPQCLESFKQMQNEKSSYMNVQRTAQEKFGVSGDYTSKDFDPMEFLTTWNFNNLPQEERKKYYKETKRPDGSLLREYWINVEDKEIEIAPGVFFPAWTYNGQVPGPTIRATEGDLIRIYFTNKGTKPHTIHFHGFHNSSMDGAMTQDFVLPGKSFTYEFEADPFGVHLFHCHASPVKQHIAKGHYGAYLVDPKNDTRPKPDKELVMVMNAFDTNFDGENEVYAVNTKAFYYAMNPIKVKKGELVRIYLINFVEFDPINSFHLHANFFDEYKTGTKLEPDFYTDTLIMGQGERSILDVRFKYPGMYMFHAHVTEFTELGWVGLFEVVE